MLKENTEAAQRDETRPDLPADPPNDLAADLGFVKEVLGAQIAQDLPRAVFDAAAYEILAYKAFEPASEVAKRLDMILMRAHARAAAHSPRPLGDADKAPRKGLSAGDIEVIDRSIPYSNYFAATELTLTHTRFDGTRSEPMQRAVFLMADAVTVLPYDPKRDRVLVVEQFRAGPFARGDQNPWMFEPIAGRVDPGQTPEQTAHREAEEEAKLALKELHLVGSYYPSPGAITENLTSFVAIADLPDDITGVSGLEHEQEDISSSLMSFDTLMELADQGALDTGPLFTSALWLARHRDRLRQS